MLTYVPGGERQPIGEPYDTPSEDAARQWAEQQVREASTRTGSAWLYRAGMLRLVAGEQPELLAVAAWDADTASVVWLGPESDDDDPHNPEQPNQEESES